MSNMSDDFLENLYKQFNLGDIPIFQNMQRISIRRLFKILTITELKDLPTVEAMNFYLYCNFFKNRLLYSEMFKQNLAYINLKSIELKQRIKDSLDKYDKMLQETKSESDGTWIDNNIAILNDGLIMLGSIPSRCDYYDNKIIKYLHESKSTNQASFPKEIESECADEFSRLSVLFSQVGQIIGHE